MTKKIAFLFLIIDNPHFPDLWDKYFLDVDKDKFNIYIHPKFPDKTVWHREAIIDNLQETGWGFIVGAYMALFNAALKDNDNIKFITISESCVPIKPFNILYNDLMKDDRESFIKMMKISNYDMSARLNENIIKSVGRKNLIKHYARMCLSRHHVKKLFNNLDKIELFKKMHVGDEFFLSSIMPINNFRNFAITFDDWDYVDKIKTKIKNRIKLLYEQQENNANIDNSKRILKLKTLFNDIAKNPKTIIKVSKRDLANINNTESYFYRKFDKNSNIRKYIKY